MWAVKDYPPASLSPSHFSWVKIDSSRVIEVLYKSPPPSHSDDWAVISGNFSFRSKNVAMNLILELLSHEESQINGEYYLDSIITFALRKGISVGVLEIPNYFSLGTVDELQTFNYWSEVLKQNSLLLHKVSDEKS